MYACYRLDARLLADIGTALEGQPRASAVVIPADLADQAIAAWNRDESDELPVETDEQASVRLMAGDLALIGLTLSLTNEPSEDGSVRAHIDVNLIDSAIAASRSIAPH